MSDDRPRAGRTADELLRELTPPDASEHVPLNRPTVRPPNPPPAVELAVADRSTQADAEAARREALRERCRQSLYFFAKFVLHYHRDPLDNLLTPHFHAPLCRLIERPPKPKQLILVPRGYLKTTIGAVAYPIWRLIRDPQTTILLASATATLAEHTLREIKAVFERNWLFRDLFGQDLFPENFDFTKTKWAENEIVVRRPVEVKEPSILAIGVGGTVVGHHFRVAIYDDLINEKHVDSAVRMQEVIDWHRYAASLLVDPDTDHELVLGTRWGHDDFYAHLIRGGQFAVYVRSAVEDGRPTFPEKYPLDALAELERRLGPYGYSANMLNAPTDPARQIFRPEWFVEVDWSNELADRIRPWNHYILVDPALSERKDGSATGYVIAAVGPGYETVVLEASKRRWQTGDLIDQLFLDVQRLPNVRIVVEMVSLARFLRYPLEQEMRRRGVFVPLIQTDTHGRSKEERIRAMHKYFANRLFTFVRGACDDLLADARAFPFGDGRYDALDALAYLPQIWQEGSSEFVPPPPTAESPWSMPAILRELRERQADQTVNRRFVLHHQTTE